MPIAKKTRFAVAALIELARHPQPHPLPQLSRRLRVSVSYLEPLFGGLRRHGIVHSMRGPGGGYRLARSPAAISVLDVATAVDGPDADPSGQDVAALRPDGSHAADHMEGGWWEASERVMAVWLAAVSLHDLVEADHRARLTASSPGIRDCRSSARAPARQPTGG